MAFYLKGSFGNTNVQKRFRLLRRLKITNPSEEECHCILFGESALASTEMILCTNTSLFYLSHLSSALSRYDYSDISAVTLEAVRLIPSVCLTIANGGVAKLYVPSHHAEEMLEYIKKKIRSPQSSPAVSAADEIMKYKSLLDMGAITQEEFEKKKNELLWGK